MSLYIVREGKGEADAMPALVGKVMAHLGLGHPYPSPKTNWKKPLITQRHVIDACEAIRSASDCHGLLLTRDADNDDLKDLANPQDPDCPKTWGPAIADWVRDLNLPFPTAVVLFYKEYETLFLSGAEGMAGQPLKGPSGEVILTIAEDVASHSQPEHPRDAKGWVKNQLVPRYKPTLHQTSLTQMLDLEQMDTKALSSYRRLRSALQFLADNQAPGSGMVYPPTALADEEIG